MTFLFFSLMLFQPSSQAQVDHFASLFSTETLAELKAKPLQERLLTIGISQEGKPYLERTLEVEGPERLIIRLDGYDCFTFVETLLAMAITLDRSWNMENFGKTLQSIRYRQGKLEDYTSRLHYTCDWAFDNLQKGYLEPVTQLIGGVPYQKNIHFMTQHRTAYRQLGEDALFEKMAPIEEAINGREHFYIPEEKLEALEAGIQPGDILAITTQIKGLDVSHVGVARNINGRLHMLHASSVNKQVETTKIPLADYLLKNKRQTGIMVFRPKNQP